MIAIVEFVIGLIILPYFLFGVLLGRIYSAVVSMFQPHLLLGSIWIGLLGLFLMPNRTPDDSVPWVSFVDVIAQSHVVGIPTPVVLLGLAGLLLVVAMFIARAETRHT